MKPIPAQAGTETSPAVTVFATASDNTGPFLRGLRTSAESGDNVDFKVKQYLKLSYMLSSVQCKYHN